MTFDEALVITAILSMVMILAGYQIMRQSKPPSLKDIVPGKTTVEQKKRAWSEAQSELGGRLRRVK